MADSRARSSSAPSASAFSIFSRLPSTSTGSSIAIECETEMFLWQSPLMAMIAVVSLATICGRSQTPAEYTAGQATDGLGAYQANCATCHLPDLAGRNEAPPLTGGQFMVAWGSRTTAA